MKHADILILGGGVIGLTTAYYLAGKGAQVALLDRKEFGQQASWAGAGIIPPANAPQAHNPLDRLLTLSNQLYPLLSQELKELTGIDNGYLVCGGLELFSGEEPPATGEWRTEGARYTALSEPDLSRLYPDLARDFTHVYHLPDLAQVRNPWHLRALIEACQCRGVQMLPGHPARKLLVEGSNVRAVETDGATLLAERFLVASGAWTDRVLSQVGWRPGIRPVRGQIALVNTGVPGVRPVLLSGKRYLVPRTDGLLLVGSTEEEAEFDDRPTAGGIRELLDFAFSVLPTLREAPLERCWAGLRPGSPDGLPFLGPVPGWDNLFVASGHFRAGIQLSPATGVLMTELLLGEPATLSLEPFRPDRPTPEVQSKGRIHKDKD
jgi:glycine oxidase